MKYDDFISIHVKNHPMDDQILPCHILGALSESLTEKEVIQYQDLPNWPQVPLFYFILSN